MEIQPRWVGHTTRMESVIHQVRYGFYTRTAGVWTQQGPKKTTNDGTGNELLGYALSLSADGNTVAVVRVLTAPPSVTNTVSVSGGGDTTPANNTFNDPTTIL
jgi:hypothetical protein